MFAAEYLERERVLDEGGEPGAVVVLCPAAHRPTVGRPSRLRHCRPSTLGRSCPRFTVRG